MRKQIASVDKRDKLTNGIASMIGSAVFPPAEDGNDGLEYKKNSSINTRLGERTTAELALGCDDFATHIRDHRLQRSDEAAVQLLGLVDDTLHERERCGARRAYVLRKVWNEQRCGNKSMCNRSSFVMFMRHTRGDPSEGKRLGKLSPYGSEAVSGTSKRRKGERLLATH